GLGSSRTIANPLRLATGTAQRSMPRLSSLYIQRDAHRAMIAAHHVRVDLGFLHFLPERLGNQYVVDSPSDVAGAGVRELVPPGVVTGALLEEAKRIDEARIEEVLKSFALFVREPLLASIRFRVRKIELGVRDVEIAAEDHRLLLFEL